MAEGWKNVRREGLAADSSQRLALVAESNRFDEVGGALVRHARGGNRFAGDDLSTGSKQQQALVPIEMKLARERCDLPAQGDSRSHRLPPLVATPNRTSC
jgi:hypothetical protein